MKERYSRALLPASSGLKSLPRVRFTFALLQQRRDDGFVFDGVERAGGVNHPASHGQLLYAAHSDAYLEPEGIKKKNEKKDGR